jgi:hypothetical protein
MDSNTKKRIRRNRIIEKVRFKSKRSDHGRRTVTQRAASSDRTCPMKVIVFLYHDNHWYLSKKSTLSHRHHPPLDSAATLRSEKDLYLTDLKMVRYFYIYELSMYYLYNITYTSSYTSPSR